MPVNSQLRICIFYLLTLHLPFFPSCSLLFLCVYVLSLSLLEPSINMKLLLCGSVDFLYDAKQNEIPKMLCFGNPWVVRVHIEAETVKKFWQIGWTIIRIRPPTRSTSFFPVNWVSETRFSVKTDPMTDQIWIKLVSSLFDQAVFKKISDLSNSLFSNNLP